MTQKPPAALGTSAELVSFQCLFLIRYFCFASRPPVTIQDDYYCIKNVHSPGDCFTAELAESWSISRSWRGARLGSLRCVSHLT